MSPYYGEEHPSGSIRVIKELGLAQTDTQAIKILVVIGCCIVVATIVIGYLFITPKGSGSAIYNPDIQKPQELPTESFYE